MITDAADRHPLAHLLASHGAGAESYLLRVAKQHQAMGFGPLANRREKLSRWLSGVYTPSYHTQLAMAAIEGIGPEAVHEHGWPGWLTLAVRADRTVLMAPWTTQSTVTALEITGGMVDRRAFMITTTGTLGAVVAQWSAAAPAGAAARAGRRINGQVPALFEARLDGLRRLDDQIGSGQVYAAARAETRLITKTISQTSYTEVVGRRLYACAAEASRSAGWTAYDSGRLAAAELHYIAALRCAADADDPVTSANILAFWAIGLYSNNNAPGAVGLIDAALAQSSKIDSKRMISMLHARACRAHARAGDARAANRSADAALATYEKAKPIEEDPACIYWYNLGEVHQLLGSSSLNLGHPRRALEHFQAASESAGVGSAEQYDADSFPRGHAIYLARLAEAQQALGDVDAAVSTAHQAVECMGGVTSARGSKTLDDLRRKLTSRSAVPGVRDFLEYTV